MKLHVRLVIFLFVLLTGLKSKGQEDAIANLFKVDYETPLTIELKKASESDEEPIEPVQKKERKKNPKIFYGIKTKRGFTKTGFGKNTVVELFHYLKYKDFEGPGKYVRDFYYYDFKKKKILNSLNVGDPKNVGVMHGHYVKKMGEQILEEGYFYKGMKHRRWVRLNRHDILFDKKVYWKGWPEQSLLAFYDYKKEILKEAIPVHFGEREGTYYAFHENGVVAVSGEYKYDKRIGIWREYYPNRRLKREISYPEDPYDFGKKTYISKEWDESGNLIYDRNSFLSGSH